LDPVHVERELKFLVDAQAAARAGRLLPFAGRPKRTQLHSVYYDTSDLRLQRAGAALRLRRAGRKWLQTLKLPQGAQGALAARAEWEMPAPHGRLDCSLFPREAVRSSSGLDLVRLARRLRPVFTTRFERRSGALALGHGVQAVACIDRGTIEAGAKREPILELELELIEGEIGPLVGLADSLVEPLGLRIETASKGARGYRLHQAAGPTAPAKWSGPHIAENAAASDAFAALCAAALAQIAANATGVAQGRDTEYLHQMRVGVRRLRSALHAFRKLLRRSQAREVEKPFKQMMQAWGRARDWDVFCEMLADAGGAPPLLARARHKRAAARHEAGRIVNSAAFQQAQLRVLRWLYRDPWKSDAARAESLGRFARQTLARLHASLMKSARKIDWRDEGRRHEVRIRVKRLRYAGDFFSGSFAHQAMRPFIERLASLQDTLGELNDVAVARRLLTEIASASETSALLRSLAARERELIGSLEPAWSAFEAKRPFWQPKRARRARR
jgi:inorganic triphosphatase YgiF